METLKEKILVKEVYIAQLMRDKVMNALCCEGV